MLDKIKKLSQLLNESYSEKSVVTTLRVFFAENFGVNVINVILKESYTSSNPTFPLFKYSKIIGHLEFEQTTPELESFLDTTLYMISLKVQNLVLSDRMQRAIDFQHSMKNIAKIIETQYELRYIIPLLGEMIDKFVQNHLIYVFVKEDDHYNLMWPNTCKDTKIFDIINAEPRKRVTTDSLGVFPLISENKILGYIITKTIDEKLNLKEIEYLEELSNQAATTINRANVYAEILKHATLDALTGVYNRRQLEERIKQEIASSHRQKTPLCAIMTDIDYFKKVNDTYGHTVGDLVLKTVSKVMRSQLREYDIAGRYGGEEFAILLPFTKLKEAKMVAERLRKSIETKTIDISEVNPEAEQKTINVTISLGIYELKTSDEDSDLLKNADKALYQAKESGRNKVVIYE
ncbi:GGDEF domain-containing protein [bacterium]|nr:GGDEF domain-containing protein [bacterium]